ncbi:MAG: DUF58 domain-containing protein [Bacteroidetes bacterium]|nr:DUF58 domain-containing protein [Bacteroidota bacterium]
MLNRTHQYSYLEFYARQVVEGFITGMHKSPFHGFSVEFAEHRLYNKGESSKHIDWKLYGRTDKLFVKKYEEETNLRCRLVIDSSSSMYFPEVETVSEKKLNKIGFSVYACAVLIELLKKQRDAIGLTVFTESINVQTPSKSTSAHHIYLLQELEKLLQLSKPQQSQKTNIVAALHQIAEVQPKRSLIIVFSDMMDDAHNKEQLFSALQHLKYNKHEVVLFHTFDKSKEVKLELENRPYQFVDLETNEIVKLNPTTIKDQYQKIVEVRNAEIRQRCIQYKIDFIEADINNGFEQIILPYLLKRSRSKHLL